MATARAQKYQDQLRNTRSVTPGIEASKHTYRLPDPPILTDGKDPTFDSWNTMIRDKLRNNAYLFQDESARIAYVFNRTGGYANKQLLPRRRQDSANPFADSFEMIELLETVLGDTNRTHTARAKFNKLVQGTRSVRKLYADFSVLIADLDNTDESNMYDFKAKLNPAIRKAIAGDTSETLKQLADKCIRIDQDLQEDAPAPASARNGPFAKTGPSTRTGAFARPDLDAKTRNTTPNRPTASNPYGLSTGDRAELAKKGLCFICESPDHRSPVCPQRQVAIKNFFLNDDTSDTDAKAVLSDSSDSENE